MDARAQRELLGELDSRGPFAGRLKECASYPMRRLSAEVLQVNVTRRCNLSCRHCHVEASPGRPGEMSHEDMKACLLAASHPGVQVLDITGGAPETHGRFEWFLAEAARLGKRLLVRSNAAILMDPRYRRFLDLYAECGVEVVVSLPALRSERTDRVRGAGVFEMVIAALGELNCRGYGRPGTGLVLDLVHNPSGAFLPGPQHALEDEYRSVLRREHSVEFNRLYCLANFPVGRFLGFLLGSGNLDQYADMLRRAFNPAAVGAVMCRSMLSVGCDGRLFDCDFNYALGMPMAGRAHIRELDMERLPGGEIALGFHCYSCTAGPGSSCQGALRG